MYRSLGTVLPAEGAHCWVKACRVSELQRAELESDLAKLLACVLCFYLPAVPEDDVAFEVLAGLLAHAPVRHAHGEHMDLMAKNAHKLSHSYA